MSCPSNYAKKPLCIDLYAGLGGWTEGFLAEGWDVIGFDIEQHVYGEERYPAQLVLQDVRTIHGKQFKHADMIVASSPCQEFSYRAMPWKRAKALGPPLLGMELFAQARRIQLEAIEAAGGRFIPMVQENVKGAQKYVGRAPWHYGSFYLWGDIPALMPLTMARRMKSAITHRADDAPFLDFRGSKNTGGSWFNVGSPGQRQTNNNPARTDETGIKCGKNMLKGTAAERRAAGSPGGYWTSQDVGVKQPGISGVRENGKGDRWFQDGAAQHGSKSSARKAASARIAKIPFPLSSHIARVYYPMRSEAA